MKNRAFLIILVFFVLPKIIFGQTPVEINESTIKVKALSQEIIYCGLCKGDQLVFNFNEVKGKELKEVEIVELPGTSKFLGYKTNKIENKTIQIPQTGIYAFRFANSAISGRICNIKIQRIPRDESTKDFNTNVFWKTVFDSTYEVQNERYLVKSDTNVFKLTDQVSKVHSVTNASVNKTTLNFTLPPNTIAWSYYIGVDQAGEEIYKNASNQLLKNSAPLVAKIAGYDPMVALALGGISYLTQMQKGESINYVITDQENRDLFLREQPAMCYKSGNVFSDFSQMLSPLSGTYFVCLRNDNLITGLNVSVKITAIQVEEIWSTRQIKKLTVSQRQEPFLTN